MADTKAPHTARVGVAQALLDRGWGKPAQSIDFTHHKSPLEDLTADGLGGLIEALDALAGGAGGAEGRSEAAAEPGTAAAVATLRQAARVPGRGRCLSGMPVLPLVGVDPRCRHQGYGSMLLRHTLAQCDRDHAPAYLESSNPANIPLYERHGFVALGAIQEGSSPTIVPMLRAAR